MKAIKIGNDKYSLELAEWQVNELVNALHQRKVLLLELMKKNLGVFSLVHEATIDDIQEELLRVTGRKP